MNTAQKRVMGAVFVALFAAFGFLVFPAASCKPPAPATVKLREDQLCELRAVEREAYAAPGGEKLAPVPGSLRAQIETAEDKFCADRGDGGPTQ